MKKWFLPVLILTLLTVGLLAPMAFGYDIIKPDNLIGPDPTVGEETRDFILNAAVPRAINIITAALGLTAFLGILIAAITMLTAYGNEDKINRAKTNLRYALLGFVLVILSYAIVSIIVSVSLPRSPLNNNSGGGGTGNDAAPTSFIEENNSSLVMRGLALNLVPKTQAFFTEDEIDDTLLPGIGDILGSDESGVALPSGNLITEVVPAVVTNIFFFIGFLVFVSLMMGGILLIFGRGNEEAISKARSIIIYSLMAIAMIAVAYAVIFGIANINLSPDPTTNSDNISPNEDVNILPF